jgi:hypothetical protein
MPTPGWNWLSSVLSSCCKQGLASRLLVDNYATSHGQLPNKRGHALVSSTTALPQRLGLHVSDKEEAEEDS